MHPQPPPGYEVGYLLPYQPGTVRTNRIKITRNPRGHVGEALQLQVGYDISDIFKVRQHENT